MIELLLELLAAIDRSALRRGNRTDTTLQWTDAEVGIAFFCRDTFDGALKEAGDLVMPISNGVISRDQVVADLFALARKTHPGRTSESEITYFKSVGTALEDLAGAITVWNLSN